MARSTLNPVLPRFLATKIGPASQVVRTSPEREIFGVPGYAPIGMTEQMDGKGRMETPRVKN